jgi:O-succinylbenzoic acid--CoA ligase
MNNKITINGMNYSKQMLLKKSDESIENGEKNSFWNFIKAWLNEEDSIEVKTSGSTGTPKIIRIKKEQMRVSALATGRFFDLKPQDKALLCLPCDYIAGKMMVVRAFVLGLDLHLVEPSANPLTTVSSDFQFAAMIPLQVLNSLENTPEQFNRIEKVIIGGGVVDNSLLKKIQNVKNQCFATYGMTETVTHVAIKKLNGQAKTNTYEALQGVTFSKDERQCLVIDAPYLAENQIVTNDVIDLKSSTSFEWVGRFDNIINTGGIKVCPEKIEEKINVFFENPFFIAAIPDEKLGNSVALFIENKNKIDTNILQNQLKTILSKFEMPKKIIVCPQFERTKTGKIQRYLTVSKTLKQKKAPFYFRKTGLSLLPRFIHKPYL